MSPKDLIHPVLCFTVLEQIKKERHLPPTPPTFAKFPLQHHYLKSFIKYRNIIEDFKII